MNYKHIELITVQGVVTLWLNRPQKRNAFDDETILEIGHAIQSVNKMEDDAILILRGRGEAFCAGADLSWMLASINLDADANYAECLNLTQCFYSLYSCNKVTIALVHGTAYGGGVGLAAACDLAICTDDIKFSLSELRMGLVASSISPYILKKLGESRSKELIFTSRQFNGKQAESYGFVNRSVPTEELDSAVNEYISIIRKGSASARRLGKNLVHQLAPGQITPDIIEKTAHLLAEVRISDDAQHRMKEFLTKVSV